MSIHVYGIPGEPARNVDADDVRIDDGALVLSKGGRAIATFAAGHWSSWLEAVEGVAREPVSAEQSYAENEREVREAVGA